MNGYFTTSGKPLTGEIRGGLFSSSSLPAGWLACDGSELDAVKYPRLAALIAAADDGKKYLPNSLQNESVKSVSSIGLRKQATVATGDNPLSETWNLLKVKMYMVSGVGRCIDYGLIFRVFCNPFGNIGDSIKLYNFSAQWIDYLGGLHTFDDSLIYKINEIGDNYLDIYSESTFCVGVQPISSEYDIGNDDINPDIIVYKSSNALISPENISVNPNSSIFTEIIYAL